MYKIQAQFKATKLFLEYHRIYEKYFETKLINKNLNLEEYSYYLLDVVYKGCGHKSRFWELVLRIWVMLTKSTLPNQNDIRPVLKSYFSFQDMIKNCGEIFEKINWRLEWVKLS